MPKKKKYPLLFEGINPFNVALAYLPQQAAYQRAIEDMEKVLPKVGQKVQEYVQQEKDKSLQEGKRAPRVYYKASVAKKFTKGPRGQFGTEVESFEPVNLKPFLEAHLGSTKAQQALAHLPQTGQSDFLPVASPMKHYKNLTFSAITR